MAKTSIRAGKTAQAGAKTGLRKPQEERWAEILGAATEVFWEKGYDAATLQDIANRVGILKGSIYYYIESKSDLRAHLLQETHVDGIAMISEVARSEPAPLTRLYKMITAHVYHVCAHMARTAVFLHEIRRLSNAEQTLIGVDDRAYSGLFQQCIAEAQAEGLIRADIDLRLAGTCTLGSMNAIYTWYRSDGDITPAEVADYFASTVLRGLASDKGLKALSNIMKPQA
jgi:AcrR family transcriptional regulator